jgi:hypothetical protein
MWAQCKTKCSGSRNWAHTLVGERTTTKDQAQKLDVRIETYLKASRRSMWIVTVDLKCLSWYWYDVTAPLLLSCRGCPRAGCTWLDYVRRRGFPLMSPNRNIQSGHLTWHEITRALRNQLIRTKITAASCRQSGLWPPMIPSIYLSSFLQTWAWLLAAQIPIIRASSVFFELWLLPA